MVNLRLSLVTSTGLLLSTKPDITDKSKQVLATGLISAIMSFSKEIHKRNLQSIAYHDRSIITVEINDEFIFVLEIMDETEELPESRRVLISNTLKNLGRRILTGVSSTNLTEGEADILVEQCLFEIEKVFESFIDQPIKKAAINYFVINMLLDPWEIEKIDEYKTDLLSEKITNILYKQKDKISEANVLRSMLMLFPEEKTVPFVLLRRNGHLLEVGYLRFPSSLDYTIFRLFPSFEMKINELLHEPNYDLPEILKELRAYEDPGNRFAIINHEYISFELLSRLVRVDFNKAIYSSVVGDTIYVIGDKVSNKIVMDHLSIFTQHLQTQFYEFVDENFEVSKENKERFIPMVIGMDSNVYNVLTKKGVIDKKATVIDINSRQAFGNNESVYFDGLINKLKDKPSHIIGETISTELSHLVSMTYIISSFAVFSKKEAVLKLKELASQWPYPNSLIKKAIKLAKKINPYLEIKG